MGRRTELRDLRSLERRSMYSIFHPLDVNERLPRELIQEGRRFHWFEKRRIFALVGVLYLPALMLTIVVLGSFKPGALVAFAIAGVALIGIYFYAVFAQPAQRS